MHAAKAVNSVGHNTTIGNVKKERGVIFPLDTKKIDGNRLNQA